jgi:hypothetical protein
MTGGTPAFSRVSGRHIVPIGTVGRARSSAEERSVHIREVAGSIPAAPTIFSNDLARIAQGSLVATRPELAEKGLALKVLDDPSIDTSAHRKNILALTAEIESDIRRERQMDGIVKAQDGDVRSGRKP